MYLKKLEIFGFKSFAEKTTFAFSDGITVIVGPNGSGKSNIADSIRWVLGEQSIKTLRGGKAEDVIFSGTQNRKPLGLAEVSLVLNNETSIFPIAFSEVKVTRRLYRSGESEYRINDASCRLKDIYDLFADSGLGKDALAIIGQGKIDEILSVRSEDRRGIIEEAAGIIRYRNRKKEAERKLLLTERDLERILDIIFTLSERIDPLKDQKETAEKYLMLDSELKELEFQLLLQQLSDADKRKNKIFDKLIFQKEELISKETITRRMDAELEQIRLQLLKDEEAISELQQSMLEITSEWEKTQGEQKLEAEKALFIDEKIATVENQLANLVASITELTAKSNSTAGIITEKEELKNKINERLYDVELQKNEQIQLLKFSEELIEKTKNSAFDCAQQASKAKNALLQKNKEQGLAIHKLNILNDKISDLTQKLTELDRKSLENNSDQVKLIDLLIVNQKQEEDFKQKLINYQHKQTQITTSVLEKNSELDGVRKQHAFYIDMEKKHEGYGHAVRALFEEKSKSNYFNGLYGTIADVISVDKKFETAIETALGGAIQNIIVNNEKDADIAITYLKKHQFGRATFLPLSVIKGEKLKTENKYLLASEVVSTNPQFQTIIESLLGRTIITDNLKLAIATAKESSYRYKIVTLEGDIIYAGGSISGGSAPKKQTAFLTRKRLIEELAGKSEELFGEVSKLRLQAEENLLALKNTENNLVKIQSEKNPLVEIKRKNETDSALIAQSLSAIKHEIVEKNAEINIVSAEEKTLINEIEELNKEVVENEVIYLGISSEIENLNQRIRDLKTQNTNDNDDFMILKTDLARLEEELKNTNESFIALNKDINAKKVEINLLDNEKNKLALNKEENESVKLSLSKTLATHSNRRTWIENKLQDAKEKKQSKQMECFEDEQKIKVLQKQLSLLSGEIHAQEVISAKIEVETEGLEERLLNEFNTTLKYAASLLKSDFNKKYSIERIRCLHDEIDALETINLNAIEEYKEVSEKYKFLNEQQLDLSAAKDSLFKVVKEIEKEMCIKFMETFDAVNQEFQKVFQQIFAGGMAKLSLNDEENILECGIDIIAQPPGKKLQHLMLLSGGEKALAAIALLFAVLRIKPAPFCVLDEIEAALDEVNVERFANFLKEYSSKTQFVIISHRQGTMEVADTLYGTTMEDSGVTKLISVKFDDRMVG